jgi:hypothetical protein
VSTSDTQDGHNVRNRTLTSAGNSITAITGWNLALVSGIQQATDIPGENIDYLFDADYTANVGLPYVQPWSTVSMDANYPIGDMYTQLSSSTFWSDSNSNTLNSNRSVFIDDGNTAARPMAPSVSYDADSGRYILNHYETRRFFASDDVYPITGNEGAELRSTTEHWLRLRGADGTILSDIRLSRITQPQPIIASTIPSVQYIVSSPFADFPNRDAAAALLNDGTGITDGELLLTFDSVRAGSNDRSYRAASVGYKVYITEAGEVLDEDLDLFSDTTRNTQTSGIDSYVFERLIVPLTGLDPSKYYDIRVVPFMAGLTPYAFPPTNSDSRYSYEAPENLIQDNDLAHGWSEGLSNNFVSQFLLMSQTRSVNGCDNVTSATTTLDPVNNQFTVTWTDPDTYGDCELKELQIELIEVDPDTLAETSLGVSTLAPGTETLTRSYVNQGRIYKWKFNTFWQTNQTLFFNVDPAFYVSGTSNNPDVEINTDVTETDLPVIDDTLSVLTNSGQANASVRIVAAMNGAKAREIIVFWVPNYNSEAGTAGDMVIRQYNNVDQLDAAGRAALTGITFNQYDLDVLDVTLAAPYPSQEAFLVVENNVGNDFVFAYNYV